MLQLLRRICARLKQSFDRIRNERLKENLLQAVPFRIASLITGLFAVLYAKLFALAESFAFFVLHWQGWLLFLLTPVCFISAWWVAKRFAPYLKGSGIPQVMAAIELATPKDNHKVKKLLSLRILVIKVVSRILLVTGGGAIGREGPTIQIAGSVFRKINELLPAW